MTRVGSFDGVGRWTAVMASFAAVVRSPGPESVGVLSDELAAAIGAGHIALARVAGDGELRAVRREDARLVELVEASGTANEAIASGSAVIDVDRAVVPVVDGDRTVGALVIDGNDGELDEALVTPAAELCGWLLSGRFRSGSVDLTVKSVDGGRALKGGTVVGSAGGAVDDFRDAGNVSVMAHEAQRTAESDRDAARDAQELAEIARDVARRAQELAESDRDVAYDALELAEAARDVARRAQELAESDRDVALHALHVAEDARDEAVHDRDARVEDARRNAETARALVRTALPQQLPTLEGVSLAAHYAPATTTGIVGGDWYDAMVLPDGRLLCSVGDAAGNGLPATAVMGRLANAARVAALNDADPATIIAVMDQALRATDAEALATAIVAVYDPERRSLRWTRAGHTPPVIARPRERAAVVEPPARPPLGVPADLLDGAAPEHELDLPPGSVCALFTDGLVERRGEHIDDGLARVTAAIDAADLPRDADRIATSIIDACAPYNADDDVCLLVLATH